MTDYEALEREHFGDPDKGTGIYAPKDDCNCRACIRARGDTIGNFPRECCEMILCAKCGNKRCPHANDHRNNCTDSNERGQPGSAYA